MLSFSALSYRKDVATMTIRQIAEVIHHMFLLWLRNAMRDMERIAVNQEAIMCAFDQKARSLRLVTARREKAAAPRLLKRTMKICRAPHSIVAEGLRVPIPGR
jgi:transposase-like protein